MLPVILAVLLLVAIALFTTCLVQMLFEGRFSVRSMLVAITAAYGSLVIMGLLNGD
jgi:hypothetical protein